jgi:hypothetical protein
MDQLTDEQRRTRGLLAMMIAQLRRAWEREDWREKSFDQIELAAKSATRRAV